MNTRQELLLQSSESEIPSRNERNLSIAAHLPNVVHQDITDINGNTGHRLAAERQIDHYSSIWRYSMIDLDARMLD